MQKMRVDLDYSGESVGIYIKEILTFKESAALCLPPVISTKPDKARFLHAFAGLTWSK